MIFNHLSASKQSKPISLLLVSIISGLMLSGCDNNESTTKSKFAVQQKIQKYKKETVLKGKVSNSKGQINSGEIKATDSKGKVVATTTLLTDKHYSITIPAGTELPVVLSFEPDEKSDAKDKLISVVIYTTLKKYDINELTTLIAKNAKALGGYTHSNMVMAADNTVGIPDANKTSTGFRGDPTAQYGGWH